MDSIQSGISYEKALALYNDGNKAEAEEMLKRMTETATVEEKCKFAEYVLFVELKYKESFVEDVAFEYIVDGTDKENKLGTELLIRYVLREKLGFAVLEKAYAACVKLAENEASEENKNQYNEWLKGLNELRGQTPSETQQPPADEKKRKKKKIKSAEKIVFKKRDIFTSILYMISSLMWIVVFGYFFLDVHSEIWTTNGLLYHIPKVSKYLVLPIPFYNTWLHGYIGYSGMFALELATLATFLTSLGKWCHRLKFAEGLKTFSDIVCALFIGAHALLQYKAGFSIFLNIKWYLIMFGVSILLGAILGLVGRKMFKLDRK